MRALQSIVLGTMFLALLSGGRAEADRKAETPPPTYRVIEKPAADGPGAWGSIVGTCRLSHAVRPQPVEFG